MSGLTPQSPISHYYLNKVSLPTKFGTYLWHLHNFRLLQNAFSFFIRRNIWKYISLCITGSAYLLTVIMSDLSLCPIWPYPNLSSFFISFGHNLLTQKALEKKTFEFIMKFMHESSNTWIGFHNCTKTWFRSWLKMHSLTMVLPSRCYNDLLCWCSLQPGGTLEAKNTFDSTRTPSFHLVFITFLWNRFYFSNYS